MAKTLVLQSTHIYIVSNLNSIVGVSDSIHVLTPVGVWVGVNELEGETLSDAQRT